MNINSSFNDIKNFFLQIQNQICQQLEYIDNKKVFSKDNWKNLKGTGLSRVMIDGSIFEQAGVNFSQVNGSCMPVTATAHRSNLTGYNFQATGISLVIHPINPYIPTSHANLRFFIAKKPKEKTVWWFGGGWDMTPYYGFQEDAIHWHQTAFNICKPFGNHVYPKYKKWCDDYFYLKHRNEQRGIGGLFFDDLYEPNFEYCFNFVQAVGNGFLKAYLPIVERRKNYSWGDREKKFQTYRRGRYVEFNLIYDRGTMFGIQTGGRIESILMSLPPLASWKYNYKPSFNSAEAELTEKFLTIQNWLKVSK